MNIKPMGASASAPATPQQSQQSGRERAMALLTAQPVQDQSNVQIEELGVVKGHADPSEDTTSTLAPVETEKTETATDPLSSQYAILARKEKQLRAKQQQQEQAYKAREEAIKSKEAEYAAKDLEYKQGYVSKQSLQNSALDTILSAGLSPDQLFEQLAQLQQTPQDPRMNAQVRALEAKIKSLEDAQESGRKSATEAEQANYQQAVNQIRNQAKKLAFTDPAFETVKATNSVNDVVELIEETFRKDGIILDVEDAMQQVEDYLVEEAVKLAKLSKIQKRMSSQVAPQGQAHAATKQQQQPQPMKTLTNAAGSTRQLTNRERAILAAEGRLK